ncbi:ABC transporter permease [Glycomyces endophyticus]|uniref:ABC transporter permease n=1 Tax=Glycomyces endophyticus TaxID=480996 RepID=A0ABP4TIF8_9ACTN
MSAVTIERPAAGRARTAVRPVRFRRVLLAETTKFRTIRSTWICLALGLVLLGLFGSIGAFTYDGGGAGVTDGPPGIAGRPLDAVSLAVMGLSFASLVFGVFGVLSTAGEYSTGTIRSTLAAVPKRLPVLWAKAILAGGAVFVLAAAGVFAAFLIGSVGLDGEAIAVSLGDDGVLRSLLGAAAYLALVAVFGVALGALLRSPAGGIAALVSVLLILPGLAMLLPDSWYDALNPYFPSNAGGAAYALTETADRLPPGEGLAVFAGWVALTLAAAAFRLKRTDV